MNTPSIHAYLEALKRREEAASKGPWIAVHPNRQNSYVDVESTHDNICLDVGRADADLIASARSDIPKLRAIVEVYHEALEKALIANEVEPHEVGLILESALTRVGQIVEGKA